MSPKRQVTITLGRSGQVVKKPGDSSESFKSDYGSPSGIKRSMRERLIDSPDGYDRPQSKRLREENHQWNSPNNLNDSRHYHSTHPISRNDLRFKLMQKKEPRQANYKPRLPEIDLRQQLSRTPQAPQTPFRVSMGSVASSSRIPPSRSVDDLLRMDSLRRKYSPRPPLDKFKSQSPDRILSSSRAISPPRSYDMIPRSSVMRPIEPPKSAASVVDQISVDAPMPSPFSARVSPFAGQTLSAPVLPSPNVAMKAPFMAGEPATVGSLLQSLGLEKYAVIFQAEEVDMAALRQMRDTDLKELGIPMGPRKKILLALAPRGAQHRHP